MALGVNLWEAWRFTTNHRAFVSLSKGRDGCRPECGVNYEDMAMMTSMLLFCVFVVVIRSMSLGPVTVTPVTGGKQAFVHISTIHVVFYQSVSLLILTALTNKTLTSIERDCLLYPEEFDTVIYHLLDWQRVTSTKMRCDRSLDNF